MISFPALPRYQTAEIRLVKVQCDIMDVPELETLLDLIPAGVDAFVNTIGTFYRAKALHQGVGWCGVGSEPNATQQVSGAFRLGRRLDISWYLKL